MHNKFIRLIIIPIVLLILLGVSLFLVTALVDVAPSFLKSLFEKSTYLLLFIFGVLFVIASAYYFYYYLRKETLFLKRKTSEFYNFYEELYDFCVNQNYSSETIKSLEKTIIRLSMILPDKVILKLNDFFSQSQEYAKDIYSVVKKEKLISFEEIILLLREELGISRLKKKSKILASDRTLIFKKLSQKWFEWSKVRAWFFEACDDFGVAPLDMMKKHSFIFVGGGPSGAFGQDVKQIRKDDIILCHKHNEGYVSVGVVTVDKKSVIWPKDGPLFYSDGEIRIPVRWLLFLNVGVDTGYIPEGKLVKFYELDYCLNILEALKERALEAGNEFSKEDINRLIQKVLATINVVKPVYEKKSKEL